MFQIKNETRNGREERGIKLERRNVVTTNYHYCPRTYMEIFSRENGSKNSPRCNYAVVINQHRERLRGDMLPVATNFVGLLFLKPC